MKPTTLKLSSNRGSALMVVAFLVMLMTIAGIAFLSRSNIFTNLTGLQHDSLSANLQLETAYGTAISKIKRAMATVQLDGRLRFVSGAPSAETFTSIANTYGDSTAASLQFLKDMLKSRAYNAAGTATTSYEYYDFATAFPTSYTDPDGSDDQYFEVQYAFTPMTPYDQTSANPRSITFDYEYQIKVRGYGSTRFTSLAAEDNGVISIEVSEAPFSQWAAFMDSMINQNGNILVFAGGNTSSQVQETFTGPVHVNGTPYFYGHPTFTSTALFTSATDTSTWAQLSDSNYDASASFAAGRLGAEDGIESITMPTSIYNTVRLAAGDTSASASTNNTSVSGAELASFLAQYAGGSVSGSVSNGIYVPIDDQSTKVPTGGIYVKGDARIQLDVVQGEADFNATQWGQIDAAYQSCKWQKFSITNVTAGVTNRDIYVGDTPCSVSYVFDTTTPANAPVLLNGRINGVVHVDGAIDELGGASRSRPAIVSDFGVTIAALKDVRIINDIQYEDVEYKVVQSDGTLGSTTVANAYGTVDSSGYTNTEATVGPSISSDSQTVLGIISTGKNILVHANAPANINIQAAIYAGNSAAYNASTGTGCGSATPGCGFGYESWNTATGMGYIKFLGSIAEYRDQTVGQLGTTPKGYASRTFYDSRLRSSISPPAYPTSGTPRAVGYLKPYRTWRVSQN